MPLHPLTAIAALLIGGAMGLVGVGGIFLIPLLVAVEGLSIQQAVGTSLVTFIVTGLVGAALYAAHGRVDWRMALLTSLGSLVTGPLGAAISVSLPQAAVKLVFALFLLVVGANALAPRLLTRPVVAQTDASSQAPARLGTLTLLACGLVVGFGSGLIGVGGPAILVPLLLLLGLPVPIAVGVSQVNQVVAAASGAAGHLALGSVDLALAASLTVFEVAGVCVGALVSRHVGACGLKAAVGVLCLAVAMWPLGGLLS